MCVWVGGWGWRGGHIATKLHMATYNTLNSDGSFPQSITQFNNTQAELLKQMLSEKTFFRYDLVILMFVEKNKTKTNTNNNNKTT